MLEVEASPYQNVRQFCVGNKKYSLSFDGAIKMNIFPKKFKLSFGGDFNLQNFRKKRVSNTEFAFLSTY